MLPFIFAQCVKFDFGRNPPFEGVLTLFRLARSPLPRLPHRLWTAPVTVMASKAPGSPAAKTCVSISHPQLSQLCCGCICAHPRLLL